MKLVSSAKHMVLQAIERLGYTVLTVRDIQQRERNSEADKGRISTLLEEKNHLIRRQSELAAERDDLFREINALDQRRQEADARYREAHDCLAQALDEMRRLKIQIEEVPQIDHQALMEQQAKLAAFRDAEPAFHALCERVKAFSMTSIERLYAMHKATEYVVKAGISGDIVECGVWRGGSMMMAALTLLAFGDTSRRLVLFDTFEGLPKPDKEKDVDVWGHSNYDEWTRHRLTDTSSDWAYASLEEVRGNMESTGYPMDKVMFVKGMVQDTIADNTPDAIALLRLDTDWYASTVCEMKYLYPRLRDQGVLIIDDYGHLQGQRQAIDEYIAENRVAMLLNRVDYSGRLAIKLPGREVPTQISSR